eukprot:jgi/Ulvmu1/1801/UM119_0019.1
MGNCIGTQKKAHIHRGTLWLPEGPYPSGDAKQPLQKVKGDGGIPTHMPKVEEDQTRTSKDAESASSDQSFLDHTPAKSASESTQQLVQPKWNWKPGEMLGKGAYGCVFLAILDTGGFAAVKQVELVSTANGNDRKMQECVKALEGEILTLQHLRHPNIVQYLGFERTDRHINIFLEWVPCGSIRQVLDKYGPMDECVVRKHTRAVVQGLHYLHKKRIMHRDIKGQNVLVDNNGTAKLTDFGASEKIHTVVEYATKDDAQAGSVKGTLYWMAPEVMQGKHVGRAADIWSLGCLITEMCTAKPPFVDQLSNRHSPLSVMYHVVNEGKDPTIPETLSKDGREFLKLCFERIPERRANCNRLLQHPFLQPLNGNSRQNEPVPVAAFHPPVNAVFSPIQEESVAPSASLSGLRPKTPDQRKKEQEYVIEPALGPKSLEGNMPRPSVVSATPAQPPNKRQFGSPVRPHIDVAQSSSGQPPRPSTQQASLCPAPLEDPLSSSRPATAAACLEQSFPAATPPRVEEYPVVPDDPMMDESPEMASAEIRPVQAPHVAASLNTFNPMMSYTDDTYQSILPGRLKPFLAIPEAVPEHPSGSDMAASVPPPSSAEVQKERPTGVDVTNPADVPDPHLGDHFQQNPLFGMESSLTQSHIGFANAAALGILAPTTPVGKHAALAPISENITPRDWQVKRSGPEHTATVMPHTEQATKIATPGSGFSGAFLRPTVLPKLTDPARPSTGQLRHGGPQARAGAGTRSQADMNMKMEYLLSRARESQAHSRDLLGTLPRQPSGTTPFRGGRASAYQQ